MLPAREGFFANDQNDRIAVAQIVKKRVILNEVKDLAEQSEARYQ